VTISLDKIVYASPRSSEDNADGLTALSENLSTQDAVLWRGLTSLQTMAGNTPAATRALGLFAGPGDRFVFVGAYLRDGDLQQPIYEYVLIGRDLLVTLAGNLQPLVGLLGEPIPPDHPLTSPIEPAEIPDPISWTQAERRASLQSLIENNSANIQHAFSLLGAALHERGLLIYGYPADAEDRVRVVQGLMALLPASIRPDLTFSTNRHENISTHARVVFAERSVTSGRWTADWEAQTFPPPEAQMPYVQHLQALWNDDIDTLLEQIDQMETTAVQIPVDKTLQTRLNAIAERHALDSRVAAGEDVAIDAIKTALRHAPPQGELRQIYASRLLHHALEVRDTDAAVIVAGLMDTDPSLDTTLYEQLNDVLQTQPDAVYAFIRARLTAALDEKWLTRLRTAALASLQIAITDGDSETVVNWLRLVAREPATYQLTDVVHNSILAALERARVDPELARGLMVLAIRRDPEAAETLMADDALMSVLPNNLGRSLREFDGDSLALLQAHGIETLLAALARAARVQNPTMFTPVALEQLWAVYAGTQTLNASSRLAADQIVSGWIADGAGWLSPDALEMLLTLALRDHRDDLFHQLTRSLAQREDFVPLLAGALHRSGRSNDMLALIAQILAVGDLSQQGVVDLYIALLDLADWDRSALPMMAQLARAVQQSPTISVPDDVLWQLLTVAADAKDELIARVVSRRITTELESVEDDPVLAEDLRQLVEQIQWNPHVRGQLMTWWRGFARAQSLSRLQKLDKVLDGSRALDELRTVVQSLVAFRKMLGKRALSRFAEDISVAFSVLQALAESYDPTPKRTVGFEPATIRAELDARMEELSPHDLKILANNFKELAQLIGGMGDNRSKATLMRRSDDVDRQLVTGEQQPHSAVDALKWMAGYLSGMHETSEEEEE
jgi:hypothetical protein